MTPDQRTAIGEDVVEAMTRYVLCRDTLPAAQDLGPLTFRFYLGDSVGDLVGQWEISVKRTSLD